MGAKAERQRGMQAAAQELFAAHAEIDRLRGLINEACKGYDFDCYCRKPSQCCERIGILLNAQIRPEPEQRSPCSRCSGTGLLALETGGDEDHIDLQVCPCPDCSESEQESVDPTKCPICGGPTTHDRSVPPNPYLCDDCNMNAALDELDEPEQESGDG